MLVPLIIRERDQKVLLGFCQVPGSPSGPQRLSVDAGITFPPDALWPQMDAPYRLSKGREGLHPECKSV